MKTVYDVLIIGTGIVGLAAAVYCGRLRIKTLVIGNESLGTLAKTHIVENYPGFKSISGEELTEKVLEHARDYDVDIVNGFVVDIKKGRKNVFNIKTKKGDYQAKTILFATGSTWRKLKVPGEEKFLEKGVHSCALCDGPLYKNKILAVAGGGDSAVKEALLLSSYANKVYVLARSVLKPEPVNRELLKKEKKIVAVEGVEVKEIMGDKFVNKIILTKEVEGSKELKVDALFVDIGHIPLSKLAVPLGVKLNKGNEIIIDKDSQTNVKGIYAAGDVTDTRFKQAITGVGEAVKASYFIYEFLENEKIVLSSIDENY